MKNSKLFSLINTFVTIASEKEVLPDNSKDLNVILKNLDKLETFGARKKYAEKNLKPLSSGSSRIVYLTSDNTVIKLAKNDKGLAQNKAESNPKMKSKFLNKIIKSSKNNVWIETYYLKKITEKKFKDLTDLDFNDFDEAIRYGLRDVSKNKDKNKPKNFDKVSASDIYKEIKSIGEKFKLMPGDLAKISSWGSKDDQPILIDSGLTKEVFEEYYESD